ncbi:MAG: SRPBCC family protein [Planctomycetes bacterium]|nr:SRPBCC family protein [Planctomycetota bacterium]
MKFQVVESIARPPAEVFAAATDFAGAPKRISGILRVEMLTDGPVGVGTRFKETRKMFGKEATEEMTVVEFDPGRRYVLGAMSCGCRYRTEIRVEPAGGGSRIAMEFAGEPLTLLGKVMSFLMRPMFKSAAKLCAKDLADLRTALEAAH